MSYPKYKIGDKVRFAGAICEVTACKDCTPISTVYRDCCSVNAVCYKYDLKYSDGVTFGYNVYEDEISPVEEEGEEKMAKIYKFKKDDIVRLKDNHAIGIIQSRDKGKSKEDFGATNMYTIRFNSKGIIGYYKESDLELTEYIDRFTDLTGTVCYIPKQADTEFVNVDFGTKYICIDAFKADRVLKNLVLVSCDDDSIVESYSAEICPIDEKRVDRDIIYKLKKSLMKKEETVESNTSRPDAKYKVGDRVIYTGPTLGRVQKGQEYIIKSAYPSVPTVTDGGYQNAYQLETVDGLIVTIWALEEHLTTAWEKEVEDDIKITEDADDSGNFLFNIDDHIFFSGHEQVIVRKMHIGLKKYYKIRHVDDDSTHAYIVSEYALTKSCVTKKDNVDIMIAEEDDEISIKDLLNAPTKEYHLNKKGISKVSGEFHSTGYTGGYTGVGEFHPTGDTGFVGGFIKASSDREIDARDKSSLLPNLMRTLNIYPKGVRVIDEGLDGKSDEYEYNMTIMVSQPLSNKSKEEVEKVRNAAIMSFVYSDNVPRIKDGHLYNIRVVDNLQYDRIPTPEEGELNHFDYLSTDIKLMKDIDFIVFAYGWQNSNGCNIEYQMAKTYGIPMYFV